MKVLLVEDDVPLCELLHDALAQAGLESHMTNTGLHALWLYSQKHHEVVVLDLNLPDINGFSVLSRIRQLQGEPPPMVIVFSGIDTAAVRRGAEELGVDDFLVKPFDADFLATRIKALANMVGHLAHPPHKSAVH